MHSLRKWNLDTLLDLHAGWLDHAEDVRLATLDALMAIAQQRPAAVSVSPVALLADWMFQVTVASQYTPHVFRFLVELGATEAQQVVEQILTTEACRNEGLRDVPRDRGRALP